MAVAGPNPLYGFVRILVAGVIQCAQQLHATTIALPPSAIKIREQLIDLTVQEPKPLQTGVGRGAGVRRGMTLELLLVELSMVAIGRAAGAGFSLLASAYRA